MYRIWHTRNYRFYFEIDRMSIAFRIKRLHVNLDARLDRPTMRLGRHYWQVVLGPAYVAWDR